MINITPASAELARQRRHRARSAGVLLNLARENNLVSPGVWGWNELAQVPQWSFLESAELLHMQRVSGAVFLSPQIARCIDGRVLIALSSSIGSSLLHKLLGEIEANATHHGETKRGTTIAADDANTLARLSAQDPDFTGHAPFDFPDADVNEIASQVDSLLCKAGSAALMSTVAPGLPADTFVTLLGSVAGTLPRAVGLNVIEQAMRLIAEVPGDKAEFEAATDLDTEQTRAQIAERTQAGQIRSASKVSTSDKTTELETQARSAFETA